MIMITVPFCFNLRKKSKKIHCYMNSRHHAIFLDYLGVMLLMKTSVKWQRRRTLMKLTLILISLVTKMKMLKVCDLCTEIQEINKSNRSLTLVAVAEAVVWWLDLHLDLLSADHLWNCECDFCLRRGVLDTT